MAKAAAATADPGDAPTAKAGPSLVVQIGVLVGLTVLAAGMGFASGGLLGGGGAPQEAAEAPAAEGAHGAPAASGHGEAAPAHGEDAAPLPGHPTLVPLAPIATNLAAPSEVWVRAELALEFNEAPPPGMAESVHQDMLAYLRSVRLHQLEGASGIIHLKADLDERARIRSDGKVTRVLIRTLLIE